MARCQRTLDDTIVKPKHDGEKNINKYKDKKGQMIKCMISTLKNYQGALHYKLLTLASRKSSIRTANMYIFVNQ